MMTLSTPPTVTAWFDRSLFQDMRGNLKYEGLVTELRKMITAIADDWELTVDDYSRVNHLIGEPGSEYEAEVTSLIALSGPPANVNQAVWQMPIRPRRLYVHIPALFDDEEANDHLESWIEVGADEIYIGDDLHYSRVAGALKLDDDDLTGADLREWRAKHGWTQQQLADHLNVHQVTVARWETGERRIRHSTWIRRMLRQ